MPLPEERGFPLFVVDLKSNIAFILSDPAAIAQPQFAMDASTDDEKKELDAIKVVSDVCFGKSLN